MGLFGKEWETPRQYENKLASRSERREMTRVQEGLRTCKYCKGVFRNRDDAQGCESWHKGIFRTMRRDLNEAIAKLARKIDRGERTDKEAVDELKRLGEKLRKVPKD